MWKAWPLVAAAALGVIAEASPASAQTVIARKVPPGSTVELVLNETKVGTATADPDGDAKLPFKVQDSSGKTEMDAVVHVDTCDAVRRVVIVERGKSAPVPEVGCTRRDVLGLFLVKPLSNIVVVDTGSPNPTVWLRQGAVDLRARGPSGPWSSMPRGLVVFGGVGVGKYRDQLFLLCGNVTSCQGSNSRTTFTLGGTYWLSRYIGAEGAYVQPADVNASGTGSNFRFSSVLEAHFFTINGKIGIPAGRVRIYGQGGTNYHSASVSTTQTNDDVQLTIAGVATTVPGGTQTIEIKTGGWGWQFGGGLEVWIKPSIGIYAEVGRTRIKGDSVEGPQGELADYVTTALAGMRFKIGK
jgi:hypothetical protein